MEANQRSEVSFAFLRNDKGEKVGRVILLGYSPDKTDLSIIVEWHDNLFLAEREIVLALMRTRVGSVLELQWTGERKDYKLFFLVLRLQDVLRNPDGFIRMVARKLSNQLDFITYEDVLRAMDATNRELAPST